MYDIQKKTNHATPSASEFQYDGPVPEEGESDYSAGSDTPRLGRVADHNQPHLNHDDESDIDQAEDNEDRPRFNVGADSIPQLNFDGEGADGQMEENEDEALVENNQDKSESMETVLDAEITKSDSGVSGSGIEHGKTLKDGPDIEDNDDAIKSKLKHHTKIVRGGVAVGGDFGRTVPTDKMGNPGIVKKKNKFKVKVPYKVTINYDVRNGLGPAGQINIRSARDSAITKANYNKVANDLTPNMADLGGRPPREKFWARDLSLKHERYHAHDGKKKIKEGVKLAENWLNTQAAVNEAGVKAHIVTARGKIVTYYNAQMGIPGGGEHRAYGDGVKKYRKRAKAIRRRGKKEKYK